MKLGIRSPPRHASQAPALQHLSSGSSHVFMLHSLIRTSFYCNLFLGLSDSRHRDHLDFTSMITLLVIV